MIVRMLRDCDLPAPEKCRIRDCRIFADGDRLVHLHLRTGYDVLFEQFIPNVGGDPGSVEASVGHHMLLNPFVQLLPFIDSCRDTVHQLCGTVEDHSCLTGTDHIRFGFPVGLHHLFDERGSDPVISVHIGNQATRRCCKAGLPRRHQSAVLLMDHTDPRILGSIQITDLGTTILRSVIHQDDLQISVGLVHDTLNADPQISVDHVDRNYNADQWLLFHVTLPCHTP